MRADRIIGLDIVRAIAIVIVVIFHSVPILFPLQGLPAAGPLIHKLVGLTEPFGILGVELFFVLSGFLIGSILIKVYLREERFGLAEIRSFLVRRWFRTLPNYWLILTINILVFTAIGYIVPDGSYLRFYFFLQNLWYVHPEFFPEAWSLAIEEWFYLTLPLVLLITTMLAGTGRKRENIFITFVSYAVIFFLIRAFFTDTGNTDPLYFDRGVRKIVLFRLDAISYGLFIAYLSTFYKERLMRVKKPLLFTGIAGVIIVTGIHYAGIHPVFRFYSQSAGYRFFHNVLFPSLIPVFFCMVLPYASVIKQIRSKKLTMVVTTISKISYSMYLVHFTLLYATMKEYINLDLKNCVPVFIMYWTAVILLSYILYRFFELPVMNLRTGLSKEEPKV